MTAATQTARPAAVSVAKRRRRKANIRAAGNVLGMALIVVWCLAPFYWMVVTSLRKVDFTFDSTPYPKYVTFDNFKAIFQGNNHFGRALINSLIIGAVVTALAMLVGATCAYAIARLHFRGKFAVLGLILAASMFPGVALVTPLFQFFTNIGWLGTYQALIIPDLSFALPLCVYVLASFFTQMPWELEQAAKVDGATPGQAFRLVILPIAAPGLFTAAILVFLSVWNEYLIASQLSNGKASVAPVTYAIATFSGSDPRIVPYTSIMAAGVVVTIPLVIVVLLFQRRIVSGLTAGGVKG
ncbi:MAG TPA: carbohydrate ABC transporter permease [Jatrophihabitans sp.]|jgi:multiple sugar transport system permease protein|nr:carbohydrate ABC transporter permease [Jatrophihabitans sp.]